MGLKLPSAAAQHALADYQTEVVHQDQRLRRLQAELEALLPSQPNWIVRPVQELQCLHGVKLLTAATVVAEAGDLSRFHKAGQLFSYAGLVPREHSSGGPAGQHRGGLTK